MLGRISSINPKSVLPQATPLPTENGVVRGMRDARRESLQRDRMSQQDRQNEQRRKDRAFEQIGQNPRQAESIAQHYGIEMTPEMRELFKDQGKTKMVIEGTQMAKNLGIERYEAARVFVENYVNSNGDILAAQRSVGGMDVMRPQRGSPYRNQVTLGRNVYDRDTGELIVQGPDKDSEFFDNPRVPPNLRMKGKVLMKGNSLDPQGDIDAFYQEVQPYLQAGNQQSPNLPSVTAGSAPAAAPAPLAPLPDLSQFPPVPDSYQGLDTSKFGF